MFRTKTRPQCTVGGSLDRLFIQLRAIFHETYHYCTIVMVPYGLFNLIYTKKNGPIYGIIDWDSALGIALPFVILVSSMLLYVAMSYLTKFKFKKLEGPDNKIFKYERIKPKRVKIVVIREQLIRNQLSENSLDNGPVSP